MQLTGCGPPLRKRRARNGDVREIAAEQAIGEGPAHLPRGPGQVIIRLEPKPSEPVNEKPSFPPHEFWDYSLHLYSQPGVEGACLTLQDEFDLDVNIVLFCLWSGDKGPGQLRPAEMLRHIRRTLKTDALGATQALTQIFRPRAQKAELDAEHVQQLLLAGIVPGRRGPTGTDSAIGNLHAYFAEMGLPTDGNVRNAVLQILAQAFPDLHAADLEARWAARD
jgi:hypothetical protein